MIVRALFVAALSAGVAGAQQRVVVSDVGPGGSGRVLVEVVGQPHRLIAPDTSWFILPRQQHERTSLLVLGRTAAISGRVEGDVVVVGGDLHVRPGAVISGRAVAIGGGAYLSTLALVGRGSLSFFDNTFEIQPTATGYALAYRSLRVAESPPLFLPGVYGLRVPTYDRVNGVSVRFGPTLSFADGRGEIDGIATYRSDLGKVDGLIDGTLQVTRRLWIAAKAERGTFSNDAWIWSDFVNSLSVLAFGVDTRNYYRADRGEATVHRAWEFTTTKLEPFLGLRYERAWSVGPARGDSSQPWSIFGKSDTLGIRRPNPPVDSGGFMSVLTGGVVDWEAGDMKFRGRTDVELSLGATRNAVASLDDADFTQFTTDAQLQFLTFGEQSFAIDVHWVTTFGATPPRQRWVYFGGSGTMPFLELLEQGGDELLLVDQRYSIPFPNLRFGLLGVPTLQLRHRMGSAGLSRLPTLEQMIGVGVMLTFVRGELQIDPASRELRVSAGFSFSR